MPTLRESIAESERAVIKDIRFKLDNHIVHGGPAARLRRLADELDGVRWARAMLEDRKLIDSADADDLREALRALRAAAETATVCGSDGRTDGIDRVRSDIARLLEELPGR